MTIQLVGGGGLWIPHFRDPAGTISLGTGLLIDANGEKAAFVGRVWNKDGTTKNITGVGFRFGAVTKGATTDITVSLQDVATANGNPDGTQDQSVNVGNANIIANTWTEVTFGTARANVPFGSLLSVVFEYQTFVTGDSIAISSMNMYSIPTRGDSYNDLYTTAWVKDISNPVIVLFFDDGTFGTLMGGLPIKATMTQLYNNTSDPRSYGLAFQFPFPCKIDCAQVVADLDSDANFILYDASGGVVTNGTIETYSGTRYGLGVGLYLCPFDAHISLSKDTEYRLMIEPQTATDIDLYGFNVNNNLHLQAVGGGPNWQWVQKTVAGVFTKTSTRRPVMGVSVIGFDDAAGVGGGLLTHPGMSGGMRG